ncbi:MAG: hypothetical protein ACTS27_00940, partial [Phycisphaerales bacterium]
MEREKKMSGRVLSDPVAILDEKTRTQVPSPSVATAAVSLCRLAEVIGRGADHVSPSSAERATTMLRDEGMVPPSVSVVSHAAMTTPVGDDATAGERSRPPRSVVAFVLIATGSLGS